MACATPHRRVGVLAGLILCAVFLLPSLAPLALYAQNSTHAHCCCKGVCHCGMCLEHHRGVPQDGRGVHVDDPTPHCPCCPVQLRVQWLQPNALAARFCCEVRPQTHPAGVPQTQARQRQSWVRTRQKRGPPALLHDNA